MDTIFQLNADGGSTNEDAPAPQPAPVAAAAEVPEEPAAKVTFEEPAAAATEAEPAAAPAAADAAAAGGSNTLKKKKKKKEGDAVAGKKMVLAKVIAPYDATSKEQLSLQKGQMIVVKKQTDTGWWQGEVQGGVRIRRYFIMY